MVDLNVLFYAIISYLTLNTSLFLLAVLTNFFMRFRAKKPLFRSISGENPIKDLLYAYLVAILMIVAFILIAIWAVAVIMSERFVENKDWRNSDEIKRPDYSSGQEIL